MFCRMLNISKSETISYPSVRIYILCCISHAFDQNMYQLFLTRISTSLHPRAKSVFQKQSNVTRFFSLKHLWYIPKIIEIISTCLFFYNTGYLTSLLVTVDVLISSSAHLFSTALPHSLSD